MRRAQRAQPRAAWPPRAARAPVAQRAQAAQPALLALLALLPAQASPAQQGRATWVALRAPAAEAPDSLGCTSSAITSRTAAKRCACSAGTARAGSIPVWAT